MIEELEQLRTYECDALTGRRSIPELVVLPRSTREVKAMAALCAAHRVPFVARGAGTGLRGALPVEGGSRRTGPSVRSRPLSHATVLLGWSDPFGVPAPVALQAGFEAIGTRRNPVAAGE